jgi:microcystin-dependent protein
MSEPFLGEIKMVGFTFAPRGWAFCSGQILSIAQNTALFSLLGTTYGGNGQTTFALPDLRGRTPVHMGQGPGLSSVTLGEMSGTPDVTLNSTQAGHAHALKGTANQASATSPSGNVPAAKRRGGKDIYHPTPGVTLHPSSIAIAGGSQPHENMQPYLGLNFVIALEGIFPSRN